MADAPTEALSVSFSDVAPAGPAYPAPPKKVELTEVPPDKSDPGYTPNTEEKPKPRRGRPPKDTRARTTNDKAPAKKSPTVAAQTDAERKAGIQGLVQIGAGICMVLDQRTPESDVSFKADGYVLANSSEQIADACVETAKSNPAFGAAIDKVTKAGPYAALVGVMMSVGVQIAANHGVQAAKMMGGHDPKEYVASVEAQAQAA